MGAGYFGALKVADKFIKQNGKIIDNQKLVDNYINNLGDLVVDFAQGKSINQGTTEAFIFFNAKLRPKSTVVIEEFIKENGFDYRSNPKEIKEVFKKLAKEDKTIKSYIDAYLNQVSIATNARSCSTATMSPFKNIKNYFETSNSLNMTKEGLKALKKCKVAIIGGAVAGATIIGGIVATVVKHKNNKNKQ